MDMFISFTRIFHQEPMCSNKCSNLCSSFHLNGALDIVPNWGRLGRNILWQTKMAPQMMKQIDHLLWSLSPSTSKTASCKIPRRFPSSTAMRNCQRQRYLVESSAYQQVYLFTNVLCRPHDIPTRKNWNSSERLGSGSYGSVFKAPFWCWVRKHQ